MIVPGPCHVFAIKKRVNGYSSVVKQKDLRGSVSQESTERRGLVLKDIRAIKGTYAAALSLLGTLKKISSACAGVMCRKGGRWCL